MKIKNNINSTPYKLETSPQYLQNNKQNINNQQANKINPYNIPYKNTNDKENKEEEEIEKSNYCLFNSKNYNNDNSKKENNNANNKQFLNNNNINENNITNFNKINYKCIKTLVGHEDKVVSLIQLNSGHIATGSYDCFVRIWDIETGECILKFDEIGYVFLFIRV